MPVKQKHTRSKNKLPRTFFILVGIAITSLALIKIFLLKQAQVFEVAQPVVVTGSQTAATSTNVTACIPRPSCLDSVPACKLPVTANMCPAPTPTAVPKPYTSPLPSGCYYQQVKCFQAPCNPILICSTTPRPSASPIPTPPPAASNFPSPVPSLLPSASPLYTSQVASFQASKPCGSDNFLYISFTCQNGVKTVFASGSCNSILAALYSSQAVCGNKLGVK